MTCDKCQRSMSYAFYINDYFWQKVVGEERFDKNVGRWCAHCTLEVLGGTSWYIVFNEPVENTHSRNVGQRAEVQQKMKCNCNNSDPLLCHERGESTGVCDCRCHMPLNATSTPRAFKSVKAAVKYDTDYAQSWHDNLACVATGEGIDSALAQKIASRFMRLWFDIETHRR